MAEETQILWAAAAPGYRSDSEAMSLALPGASRAEADALLREQRHHLHEQMQADSTEASGKNGWACCCGLADAVVGMAVPPAGLAYMVWDAAHSQGPDDRAFLRAARFGRQRHDRRSGRQPVARPSLHAMQDA